ncbi:MAG: polysaccharide pyruvyl transferase family protein [Ruminococcus sp.]|nr:polysaccharide pyruvyl transferase family protein [Ruminococcus sp.]MDD5889894.1 polysaccharide pyruvyl transferase family protein [Ruminococcus sp.]MDD6709699.1 polysaccharide pyruvyl transferase family protein [Ruminococcus sp.]
MRVGIVTITNNGMNYGNQLQNYAVVKCLNNVGVENVDTLYNLDGVEFLASKKRKIKGFINEKLKRGNYCLKRKERKFDEFGKKYLHYTKPFSGMLSKEESDKYDFFICGSDQIWNLNFECNNRHYPFIFMEFAPKEKCIGFSISIGVSEYSGEKERILEKGIENFKAISVREQSGQKLIKDVSGVESELLLDPTMLIDKKDWISVMTKPQGINEKYLLCYFLGEISAETQKLIDMWAEKYNLKVVMLNSGNADENVRSAGPQEFIYYFANADLVCTDSFHGTVFSILFETPFVVFDRKDSSESSNEKMSSRLETLLGKFSFTDRFNRNLDEEKLFDLSFENSEKILLEERNKAEKYLKKAMNI